VFTPECKRSTNIHNDQRDHSRAGYYRTTAAFARLQQQAASAVISNYNGGQAPMNIAARYKGKGGRGKGNKGYKGKQQEKGYKGKGIGKGYGYNTGYGKAKRKAKGKQARATDEGNRQRARKEQRRQQRRTRKEPNGRMVQMWPTKSLG
jgi:hypothetical protein